MKAVVLRQLGDPDQLRLDIVPDPTPEAGSVVIRLRAAALNHRDVWIRKGQYAGIRLPAILGSDGAGDVVTGGEFPAGRRVVINPALDWGPDDRAFSSTFRILGMPDDGTYAEMVQVPSANVHPAPDGWSWAELAALPLAGLTAYRAVVSRGQVRPGDRVLITGIGGGVSQFAQQIAGALGARVWVTSRSESKIRRAVAAGAVGGAVTSANDWPRQIVRETDGGPDLIIDSVGGPLFNGLIEACRPGGRIVTYGATLGAVPEVEVRRVFWKQLSILGTTMGNPGEFAAMLDLFAGKNLRPAVDQIFPLADAAEAHRRMERGDQFGKIVLDIA
jgi:NADPH:quinone reductase-like Zn-dependent oxidoreductase